MLKVGSPSATSASSPKYLCLNRIMFRGPVGKTQAHWRAVRKSGRAVGGARERPGGSGRHNSRLRRRIFENLFHYHFARCQSFLSKMADQTNFLRSLSEGVPLITKHNTVTDDQDHIEKYRARIVPSPTDLSVQLRHLNRETDDTLSGA